MEVTSIKNQFRPLLPKGFVDIIRIRLAKRGISRSRSYIGDVCNPLKDSYESEIITEALNIAAEQKLIIDRHKELANQL